MTFLPDDLWTILSSRRLLTTRAWKDAVGKSHAHRHNFGICATIDGKLVNQSGLVYICSVRRIAQPQQQNRRSYTPRLPRGSPAIVMGFVRN